MARRGATLDPATVMKCGEIEAPEPRSAAKPARASSPDRSACQRREAARVHADGRPVEGHYSGGRLRRTAGSTAFARFTSDKRPVTLERSGPGRAQIGRA